MGVCYAGCVVLTLAVVHSGGGQFSQLDCSSLGQWLGERGEQSWLVAAGRQGAGEQGAAGQGQVAAAGPGSQHHHSVCGCDK